MRFVIIGGDAAGMSAASSAKRKNPDMEVVVLEKTHDVSYSACGMPYNIADPQREISDLVVRQAGVFRDKQKIDLRTGHNVAKIDPQNRSVLCINDKGKETDLSYDKLLIATGASAIIPDLPGIDLKGVLSLKSLEDGRKIKSYIKEKGVKNAVIIGMGYIALEMCEALRANSINVNMIKPRTGFIPWMNDDLSEMVKNEVEKNKVGINAGYEIRHIEQAGNSLKVVCGNFELKCDMVLMAIGVIPNSGLAEEAGLALGPKKSIAVDRTMITSNENIYAAGDCADAFHVVTGERAYIPLALRANRGGKAVAENLTGSRTELEGIAGTAVFKVFDLEVARTGLGMEEAKKAGFEPVEAVIKSRSRAHSYSGNTEIRVQMVGDKKSGRLLGVQMVGIEGVAHRINVSAVALHSRMTVEDLIQCDFAYAPPFGPVWDPVLTAAVQLKKKM